MKRRATTYARDIWIKEHGPIPKDETGRSYEVHHRDGNHANNDIVNFQLVTIEEHFRIHESRSEWGACKAISIRMKTSPEEKSRLTSLANLERISNGTHNFLGPDMNNRRIGTTIQQNITDKVRARVSEGKHNFQSDGHKTNNASIQRNIQAEKFKNGIHVLQSQEKKEKARLKTIERRENDRINMTGFFSDDNPGKRRVSCICCRKETSPGALTMFHQHIG